MNRRLPLEGIRVLEHGEAYAAAMTSTLLGDYGAEVIEIEAIQHVRVGRGNAVRPPQGTPGIVDGEPGARPWDRQAGFNGYSRNKMGITLDLTRPRGLELYHRLVRVADIVVENFSARVREDLGLTYEALSRIKPDLIVISLSGFGRTGPYKPYGTFGRTVDAMVGNTALRGYPGDEVNIRTTSHVYPDNVGGATGAFTALAALHYRSRTGKGQFIDISQTEGFLPHLGDAIMDFSLNGRVAPPRGNRSPAMAPQGCYPCAGDDRWIAITCRDDRDWDRLRQALGDPAWSRDPLFADLLGRLRHQDELDAHLTEWTLQRAPDEAMRHLQGWAVPAAQVLSAAAVYSDPHLRQRGFLKSLSHREAGTHEYPGLSWQLSRTPGRVARPAPCLGEHNNHVFEDILGLAPEEIAALEAEHYIGDAFLEDAILSREDKARSRSSAAG